MWKSIFLHHTCLLFFFNYYSVGSRLLCVQSYTSNALFCFCFVHVQDENMDQLLHIWEKLGHLIVINGRLTEVTDVHCTFNVVSTKLNNQNKA